MPGHVSSRSSPRHPEGLYDQPIQNLMRVSESTLSVLEKGRRAYNKIFPGSTRFAYDYGWADVKGQAASDLIAKELLAPKPSMICRFGMTELYSMLAYLGDRNDYRPSLYNHFRYITGGIPSYGYDQSIIWNMHNLSGFFPKDRDLLVKFADRMLADIKLIDILGTWRREEKYFADQLSHVVKVELPDLEPYTHKDPWSHVLEGKRVLVVHPFEQSIGRQYQRRELLFKDPRILPKFQLITIKAVQSVAESETTHASWFDALKYMEDRISAADFDIAIIGCGAYGLPLAAHVKRIGRKAVHLGGATQLMFGISGKRWEGNPLINEHWVRPDESERPAKANVVEGACYW